MKNIEKETLEKVITELVPLQAGNASLSVAIDRVRRMHKAVHERLRHIEIHLPHERAPVSLPVLQQEREFGHATLREVNGHDEEMTCDNCSWAACCTCAWDLYNTNGDCLLSK